MTARGPHAIGEAFRSAAARSRAALVPYLVCGRPSVAAMPALIAEIVAAGADVVELGVPFSDPLADGPVIRDATRAALDDGVDVASCLGVVAQARSAGIVVPLVLMGYVNPLLAYGIERFCADAAAAGVDGLIIPDAPPGSDAGLAAAAAAAGLALTYLVTPLTDDARLAQLAAASTGFLYAVATTGTTGERDELDPRTLGLLTRARAAAPAHLPVAVGFGVSTPSDVARLAPYADGVVVGSALVAACERDPSSVAPAVAALHAATPVGPVLAPTT